MSFFDIYHEPAQLEREIDQGRLHNQWHTVLKLLERLTLICNIGAASLNVDAKLRTYYWTVMAEVLMEHLCDYPGAMACVRKAVELDHNATEWRIIFARLLLDWTSSIIIPGTDSRKDEASKFYDRKERKTNFRPEEVLSETLKVSTPFLFHSKILVLILNKTGIPTW
jgi:hypothetical protein